MQEHEREYYRQRDHNISLCGKAVRLKTKHRQHYFGVREYGSLDAALEAARQFRDRLPADSFRGLYDHDKYPARGASGVLGVVQYVQRGEHVEWVARWQEGCPPNRRQKQRKFSFARYGDDALKEAEDYRKQMVEQHSIANCGCG